MISGIFFEGVINILASEAFMGLGYMALGIPGAPCIPFYGLYLMCTGKDHCDAFFGGMIFAASPVLIPAALVVGAIGVPGLLVLVTVTLGLGLLAVAARIIEETCKALFYAARGFCAGLGFLVQESCRAVGNLIRRAYRCCCREDAAVPDVREESQHERQQELWEDDFDVEDWDNQAAGHYSSSAAVSRQLSHAQPSAPLLSPRRSATPSVRSESKKSREEIEADALYARYTPNHSIGEPLSDADIKKIETILEKNPMVRGVFESTLLDCSTLQTMRIPVIDLKSGKAFDLCSLEAWRKQSGVCSNPETREVIDMQKLVPFESAGLALRALLTSVKTGQDPEVERKVDARFAEQVKSSQIIPQGEFSDILTQQQLIVLSQCLNRLTERQQAMYDIVCRCAKTNIPMRSPAMIEGAGHVYEYRTLIEWANKHKGKKDIPCPMNPNQTFRLEQIRPCRAVGSLLIKLGEVFVTPAMNAQKQAAVSSSSAEQSSSSYATAMRPA